MQRIRHNVVDLVWRLVVQHQEISVNADEAVAQRPALGLLDYPCPVLLADELDVALRSVGGEEISAKVGQLYLLELFLADHCQSLEMCAYLH